MFWKRIAWDGKYPIAADENAFSLFLLSSAPKSPFQKADDGRRWYSCGLGLGISSREAEEPE